jgi:ribosomal protein L6P/L9E
MEKSVFYIKSFLSIKNPSLFFKYKGKIFLNINSSNYIALLYNNLFLLNNSFIFLKLQKKINKKINKKNELKFFLNYFLLFVQGFNLGFYIKMKLVGLGFKLKRVFLDNKRRYLKITLGFSHIIFFKVPEAINVFVKKRFFFLQASNFNKLMSFIRQLQNFRQINSYKEKGILRYNQKLKLKSGKKQQK